MKKDAAITSSVQESLDPRVYFALERTYLAWVRTGLTLMGFGFVVARFSLLWHELGSAQQVPPHPVHEGFSMQIGTILILFGVGLTLTAVRRYWHTLKRLNKGEVLKEPSRLAISLGTFLAVAGCVLVTMLVARF